MAKIRGLADKDGLMMTSSKSSDFGRVMETLSKSDQARVNRVIALYQQLPPGEQT